MKKSIQVVGLGPGEFDQLSFGVYRILKDADRLFLRTAMHPAAEGLKAEEIPFRSFDDLYEQNGRFESVYEAIYNELVAEADKGPVVYAVPGHPLVAEKTTQLLLERREKDSLAVEIAGGQSFIDPMLAALGIDPIEGFVFVDAMALDEDEPQLSSHTIVCQVYDAFTASEVKLKMLEHLPPEYPVKIVKAAGTSFEKIIEIPLEELDRTAETDNLTSVYIPPVEDETLLNHTFRRLRDVIRTLRAPGGCPWDQKQTHESLKKYLIEEAEEVLEAIDEEDDEHLTEELGDVLLQVMLHAQIGEDDGYFNIYDVIKALTDKMIRRHPHVFSDVTVADAEEVAQNWEAIKKKEREEE